MTRIEWAVEQSRGISIPCPSYDEAFIHVQEWVPAAEELRQAGAAILQPDKLKQNKRGHTVTQVAIYSALYGAYEAPKPLPVGMTTPCYMFTDDPELEAPGWIVRYQPGRVQLDGWRSSPLMQAKWWKTHPDEAFGHAFDVTCWVDASMTIVSADYAQQCLDALGDDDWAMVAHPGRSCIYDEAAYSKTLPRYREADLDGQVAYYRDTLGHPAKAGLFACGANAIRHNDRTLSLLKAWWWECATRTWQDQLSLPVLVRLPVFSEVKWNTNIPWCLWWDVQNHPPG